MKVSYKWLQEYFDEKLPSPEKLEDLLTIKAFEIEGLEKVETAEGEDTIIDVDVLPNRSHDCLSHNGIAREIATITDLKLNNRDIPEKPSDFETEFNLDVQSDVCRRYIGCEIQNVKITESPNELKSKMQALGQKSINNIVDITNIVMYEIGQPMHAFDTDKMEGKIVKVRAAQVGEQITTLDKKLVELDEDILLIADENSPLAIAGIKGGNKAEVNSDTKNILLESANFHQTIVRKTARRIGINTDSSKRFENEITPELAMQAMNRAIELIMHYAATDKTVVSNKIEHYPKPWRAYRTGVSVSEINSLLGVKFSEKEVASAFDKLGFRYEIVNPREQIVEQAQDLLDRPYKYGASVFFDAPKCFDCSSLMVYLYSLVGYSIPRMAVDQYVYSQEISKEDLQPGDLIFSNTGDLKRKIDFKSIEYIPGTEVASGVDHVGIYLGSNKIIHATESGEGIVIEENLNSSERFENVVKYGRIISGAEEDTEKRFAVEAPLERLDIKTGADLVEEIGRILGYENVVDASIEMPEFKANINNGYLLSTWLKKILVGEGYSEIITYSFNNDGTLEPLKPIAEDKAYVRGNLTQGMLSAFDRNLNNADLLGLDHLKMFEIGKVFEKTESHPEPESKYGINENLMLSIGVRNKTGVKKPKASDIIRETAQILETELGVELKLDIKDDTEVVEINLDNLLGDEKFVSMMLEKTNSMYQALPEIPFDTTFKTISQYPFMLRDIAVWVPSEIDRGEIVKLISEIAGELLVNTTLFDVYEKDGRTSYAHRLVFQSQDRTLTDEEANEIMDKVTSVMQEKGWEVR